MRIVASDSAAVDRSSVCVKQGGLSLSSLIRIAIYVYGYSPTAVCELIWSIVVARDGSVILVQNWYLVVSTVSVNGKRVTGSMEH